MPDAHFYVRSTGLVASITQTGGNFTYEYDDNGNILRVVQDGVATAYTYDALGQLIRVDDQQENATWVYAYDQGGNILSKCKYAYGVTTGTPLESKTFTYSNANWRDQLTAVNGVAITYDQIGNPLNDGTWQYEWVNGRQLARMYNVDTDASFVYNENGLRVQKTVNGVVTKYTLSGKNVVHMTQGSNELHFFYDAQNKPAVVVYNGVPYSYVKNLQGDIVAILDSSRNVVVSYVYDAWGRPISKTGSMAATLGTVQPFRYRGYVYDEETKLYYLRSRYYNANQQRFMSADDRLIIIAQQRCGNDTFAYCLNNPIMYIDESGHIMGPILLSVAYVNHILNYATSIEHESVLKDSYTIEEAETAINKILSDYSNVAHVKFTETYVEIIDSYKVDDREARQRICQIIVRTGVTEREADDLAAEWFLHNCSCALGYRPGQAKDVALDYVQDSRKEVRVLTDILEYTGFE